MTKVAVRNSEIAVKSRCKHVPIGLIHLQIAFQGKVIFNIKAALPSNVIVVQIIAIMDKTTILVLNYTLQVLIQLPV